MMSEPRNCVDYGGGAAGCVHCVPETLGRIARALDGLADVLNRDAGDFGSGPIAGAIEALAEAVSND